MQNLADFNESARQSAEPIQLRNATADDFPAVMEVEAEWPEGQRATVEKFRSRLSRFPQGFFVALIDERIVGISTSCVVRYDPQHLDRFSSWGAVTNDGYLPEPGTVKEPNALYIV